ncbi:MAG: alpha/beta fold hydrolase [Proteobacteria bacterium]|nr:alpha/beta fold hydrolase [Pseudomonadota bacterium]
MQIRRFIFALWSLLIISLCAIGPVLADSYPAMPEALDAMQSDRAVTVREVPVAGWEEGSNFYYAFEPKYINPTIGFIIYPGALVDPRAYAPAAHAIAQKGYLTVIVKMVEDLAVMSYTRADQVISDYPGIKKWIIGGHSLGGAMACAYAKEFTDTFSGVVLWASYPSETFRLDDKPLKVVSIYGTKDGAVDEIIASKEDLPPDTQFVAIEGGNHTQFGWYWDGQNENFFQPGDNPADISREEQQEQIITATADFLKQFKDSACPVVYLLGEGNRQVDTLREFRDTVLARTAAGKQVIGMYYKNGAGIITVLEKCPAIKKYAKALLESSVPLLGVLLKAVNYSERH